MTWSRRTWTIQEHARAKDLPMVICGPVTLPWTVFEGYHEFVERLIFHSDATRLDRRLFASRFAASGGREILWLLARWSSSDTASVVYYLIYVLWLGQYNNCTHPLDQLYGLYGILSHRIPLLRRSNTTRIRDIFAQAFCEQRYSPQKDFGLLFGLDGRLSHHRTSPHGVRSF
jgi:hypothetical protein